MQCDICGKELPLVRASVEGVVLNVCKTCAQFGKEISQPKPKALTQIAKTVPKAKTPEPIMVIVKDFGQIIKNARESIGLKQEDFAKKINEKLSLVHIIESGHRAPSLELAQKIEKFLRIKLVEEFVDEKDVSKTKGDASLTIGDIINVR